MDTHGAIFKFVKYAIVPEVAGEISHALKPVLMMFACHGLKSRALSRRQVPQKSRGRC